MNANKHRKGAYAYNKLWKNAFDTGQVNMSNVRELAKEFMIKIYNVVI